MSKKSAGIMMYHFEKDRLNILLGHMGGPFWRNRDDGGWSILKGEYDESEDPFTAAKREFEEETGMRPEGDFIELNELKQSGGKKIKIWALEGYCNPSNLTSNTFEIEWPPKSGKMRRFPEMDRFAWYTIESARKKILKSQRQLIDQLCEILNHDGSGKNA
ncbi:MAG: NUDIX domain-containing protein [Chitinivibrionales bacterium]|nr:NUDIX domain-containing protein [Chitinivibrionales bacterium]